MDMIKSGASNKGIKDEDKCDYDQLFDLMHEVFDNSEETIRFELDQIFREIVVDKGKDNSVL